jgi:glycosyltransferase involved in cell wall biosynthesis
MDRNFSIGTIFHGQRESAEFQDALGRVLLQKDRLVKLHTACRIMEERFVEWGIPREMLVRIPLGVDLTRFQSAGHEQREAKRRELGVPLDAFCIGSFHKDGQGWGEGEEPKGIKGPDVLVETLNQVHKKHKVFVLLSAPARGYVKKRLNAAGIRYVHVVEEDFARIPELFRAIDLYLLTSREEGGPNGVLEAMASGVPFVGTRVGLVPDVISDGKDGLLADIDDVETLSDAVCKLIDDTELRGALIRAGLESIQAYDWPQISARYYRELYAPLLTVAQ